MGSAARFFLLTAACALPLWLLGGQRRLLGDLGVGLPLSALVFLAPLVSALVLVGRREGWPGIRRLLGSTLEAGAVRGRWLAVTLALLPALYAASFLFHRAAGRVPDPTVDPVTLAVLAVVFWTTAAAEEIGWTACATASLLRRQTALATAVAVGVVWAGLHVVPDLQGGHDWGWILGQRTHTVALRVLIVWLYVNTGRTLAAPVVFHALDNLCVFGLFPAGDGYVPVVTATATTIAATWVVARHGPRTLRRAGR
nr:CPBP family intramembrane metalloprotease [Acidimicrobiia bacterium]